MLKPVAGVAIYLLLVATGKVGPLSHACHAPNPWHLDTDFIVHLGVRRR